MTETSVPPINKRGRGRPQRRDEHGLQTDERLLDAAVASCVERGFEGATVADIAKRAGITVPAIYNYYPTKSALLMAAARRAFDHRFATMTEARSPSEMVAFMLSPELHSSRRLSLELHNAAARHDDIAELLDTWHADSVKAFRPFVEGPNVDARLKSFSIMILGLLHIDEVESLPGSTRIVSDQLAELAGALFAGTFQTDSS